MTLLTAVSQGGGDDSEDDDEYDEAEETPLESYETPLDKEDCAVDEYQVFKGILQSTSLLDHVLTSELHVHCFKFVLFLDVVPWEGGGGGGSVMCKHWFD